MKKPRPDCSQSVTEYRIERPCRLRAAYRLTRTTDGDVIYCCGIHKNQLTRFAADGYYKIDKV